MQKSLFLVVLTLLTTTTRAQPVPTIQSATPDVLQRGHTATLTLTGDNLSATQLLLTGPPGVTATLPKPSTQPTTQPAKQLSLTLTTSPDAPRGPRELRLVTPHGVTKPLLLFVDDLPPVAEKEPNNSPGEANHVALPAIITGRIQADVDVDHFTFTAAKGQRLVFDVNAFRSGSKLDASLTLLDSAGRRIAHDEDTNGLDPLIDVTIPADGRYTLRIQDLQYKGGPDFTYRIRAGELPRTPTTLAAPPADLAETPEESVGSTVNPPVVVKGKISKPNETDTFKFKPATTQPLVLEVAAQRFGSRLDALLTLSDESGKVLQRNDDAMGADARIQFTPEKDKTYLVSLRDLTNQGGDDYPYRLSIAPPRVDRPDFDVTLHGDAYRLNKGARTFLRATVARKGGFKPDITVALFPLPPGVTCRPLVATTQPTSGVFTLAAAPDAPTGFYPLNIIATAMVDGEMITKTVSPNPALKSTPQAYLTIHDAAPFRIERLGPVESDPKKRAEQIAALEKTLATQTPMLDEAQAKWEQSLNLATTWEVLDLLDSKTTSGAKLTKQPDGSLVAQGPVPNTDTYTISVKAPAHPIRFIRLEALADLGKGPGRAENKNFVLSRFAATMKSDAGGGSPTPVEFSSAKSDFNQQGFPVEDTLTPKPDGGWAIFPDLAKSHVATYTLKSPATGSTLTFTLEHTSKYAQHVLGHFRLLATSAEKPDDTPAFPAPILALLKTPADARSAEQKASLATYYRSIAPDLKPTRDRLATLKEPKNPFPPVTTAPNPVNVEVNLARDPNFEADITLTIDGYSSGLDEKKEPTPVSKNLDVTPVTLKAKETRATLTIRPRTGVEKGTRDIILRAETTINGAKYTLYSAPFPLTIK
jgi:hypothetical protein